tara:strand:- start:228 stop:1067 length:840 start_codon:yes stop_codon:yes gene_type:complete
MPPKKRKRKSKSQARGQSQRQSVVVNIGSSSKPRKSSGRGNLPPPSHAHNLAPTFVTAPQVDYAPLLAMMQHHARPIVAQAPMPVTTTPLSSATTSTNTESVGVMAGLAAERRAGPTAANFQPPASLASERSASSASSRSVSEASERSVSVPLLAARFDKPEPLSRGPSAVSSMTASTQMTLPGGKASVSTIKEMGAAEERGRAAREADTLAARRKAFGGLQAMARKGKIGLISKEFGKVKPSNVTPEQRSNFRSTVFGAGLNLTDLTTAAQARTREPR